MKLHGGWSLFELYNLPIGLRNWFCDRLANHFEKQKEEIKRAPVRRFSPEKSPEHQPAANQVKSKKKKTKKSPDNNFGLLTQLL